MLLELWFNCCVFLLFDWTSQCLRPPASERILTIFIGPIKIFLYEKYECVKHQGNYVGFRQNWVKSENNVFFVKCMWCVWYGSRCAAVVVVIDCNTAITLMLKKIGSNMCDTWDSWLRRIDMWVHCIDCDWSAIFFGNKFQFGVDYWDIW